MSIIFLPLFLLEFIAAVFLAFYIPGIVVMHSAKISSFAKTVSGIIVGITLWGWQGYILGYLHIRWATYIYLAVFIGIYIKKYLYKEIRRFSLQHVDWLVFFLIVVGVIGQTFCYWEMGIITSQGIMNVAFNTTDHYWHASMINEMVKRFPPFEPGMYGILKTNYHYWFNLVTADLIRVFHIPLFQTQVIGMYVLGSLLLGLIAYVLGTSFLPTKNMGRWMIFFLYFGGDASYWITWLIQKKFDFAVPSLIEYGIYFMDNPPRAFSIIIGLCAIYLLFLSIDKQYTHYVILAILFGSLVGFKIYTGIALLAGLGVLAVFQLCFKKRYDTMIIFIAASILSAGVFLPVNANSGGLFFLPFEKVRDFITYKPLGFSDLDLRWRIFYDHHNLPRLLELGLTMTGIYFISQFGTKMIGLIPYKKTFQLLGREKIIFCFASMFSTIFLGMFFIQKANLSESYNFFLPASIFFIIFASLNLSLFLRGKSKLLTSIIIFCIVFLTIPRWIYHVQRFAPQVFSMRFNGVKKAELDSYSFLKINTPENSLVLVLNRGSFDATSAIVSVFSDRPMFLSGQGVIRAHSVVNKNREDIVKNIYESIKPDQVNYLLNKSHITYLYFYGKPELSIPIVALKAKTVFYNEYATIMRVTN